MNLGEVPQGRGEGGNLTSLDEASGGSHMPEESPLDAQQPWTCVTWRVGVATVLGVKDCKINEIWTK